MLFIVSKYLKNLEKSSNVIIYLADIYYYITMVMDVVINKTLIK